MTGTSQGAAHAYQVSLRGARIASITGAYSSAPGRPYLVMRNRLVGGAARVDTGDMSLARMAQRVGRFAPYQVADPRVAGLVVQAHFAGRGQRRCARGFASHPPPLTLDETEEATV
jgi:hypothetical protein